MIDSAMAIRGLDFQPASVGAARTFTETVLREWGVGENWENARLLVSELVTNACTHARPRRSGTLSEWSIQVGLVHRGSHVSLLVFDPSYREPALRAPDRFVEGGCGLRLIEFFSSDWGWDILDGQGKVVWADITMSGRS
ncbi:ATP-binding protein [Haloactinospora alba]|uniref:ATP-binding protein n=1 Tax=Haloactinospora alba TaxID=405555 RepID=UPI001FEC4679|nr:ATP-binding protein [Haloactinospora alba]